MVNQLVKTQTLLPFTKETKDLFDPIFYWRAGAPQHCLLRLYRHEASNTMGIVLSELASNHGNPTVEAELEIIIAAIADKYEKYFTEATEAVPLLIQSGRFSYPPTDTDPPEDIFLTDAEMKAFEDNYSYRYYPLAWQPERCTLEWQGPPVILDTKTMHEGCPDLVSLRRKNDGYVKESLHPEAVAYKSTKAERVEPFIETMFYWVANDPRHCLLRLYCDEIKQQHIVVLSEIASNFGNKDFYTEDVESGAITKKDVIAAVGRDFAKYLQNPGWEILLIEHYGRFSEKMSYCNIDKKESYSIEKLTWQSNTLVKKPSKWQSLSHQEMWEHFPRLELSLGDKVEKRFYSETFAHE